MSLDEGSDRLLRALLDYLHPDLRGAGERRVTVEELLNSASFGVPEDDVLSDAPDSGDGTNGGEGKEAAGR